MRLNLTLFFLLLFAFSADAQKLTGIWRGYFTSTDNGGIYRNGTREETYKYEIQIDQQSNDGVKGVTYSYKNTVFFGKAELQGIFTGSSRSMVFKEVKMIEIKIGDKSEPCLMTCYLDYSKIGKLEVLEGTFISINTRDKSDCGSGKVYLERVPTSDFKVEDFLLKKKSGDSDKTSGRIEIVPKNNPAKKETPPAKPVTGYALPPSNSKLQRNTDAANVTPKQTPQAQKPAATTKSNSPAVKHNASGKANQQAPHDNKSIPPPTVTVPENTVKEKTIDSRRSEQPIAQTEVPMQQMSLPKVLIERENKLERVFTTSEEDLEIAFYDNGEIDNDTISVYHNNKIVINNGRLTLKPITVHIKSTKTETRHELIVVAENLGEIPPNTTLLVISPNTRERKEITLTSTEKRNAKVIINYVPKQ